MTALETLIEDKKVSHYVRSQYKKIDKNRDNINCKTILTSLGEKLKETYTISKQTPDEIIIKVDKKRNVDDVKADIRHNLKSLLPTDIDVDFLFKILKINNEIIVRTKRNV